MARQTKQVFETTLVSYDGSPQAQRATDLQQAVVALPEEIRIGRWKILGDRIVCSRIKESLQESVGSQLNGTSKSCGNWKTLVNSYADVYRV